MEFLFFIIKVLLAVFVLLVNLAIFCNFNKIIIVDKERYEKIKDLGYRLDFYIDNLIDEDMKKRENQK